MTGHYGAADAKQAVSTAEHRFSGVFKLLSALLRSRRFAALLSAPRKRRPTFPPLRRLLVGVTDAQHSRVGKRSAGDLQAER
jgi:hypothetical protein